MAAVRQTAASVGLTIVVSLAASGCASWGFQPAERPPIAAEDIVDIRPNLNPRNIKLINMFTTLHHKNEVRSILRDGYVEEPRTSIGAMMFGQGPGGVIELNNGDQIDYQLGEDWGRPTLILYMPDGTRPMVVGPQPDDDEEWPEHC